MKTSPFLNSLKSPLILDGATGTELNRRGVDTGLPLWSANALLTEDGSRILQEVHEDYLRAGAEILTTNTFRTHRRALSPSDNADRALELTRRAVSIARAAIISVPSSQPRYVAGSISTLEDCYRPDLVPPDDQLQSEHAERVQHLLQSGVDIFLVETINSIREALAIARLAVDTGKPVIVSFVCGRDGRILSGETLTDAAGALLPLGVDVLGVNCVAAPDLLTPLSVLRSASPPGFPLIAYGNIGYATQTVGWVNTDAVDPEVYSKYALTWQALIVGGCCGTTPAHIAQLHRFLRGMER
jgi:homocysteine S-methyltransferase